MQARSRALCQFRPRAPHQIAMGSRSRNAVVLPTFDVIGPGSPVREKTDGEQGGVLKAQKSHRGHGGT